MAKITKGQIRQACIDGLRGGLWEANKNKDFDQIVLPATVLNDAKPIDEAFSVLIIDSLDVVNIGMSIDDAIKELPEFGYLSRQGISYDDPIALYIKERQSCESRKSGETKNSGTLSELVESVAGILQKAGHEVVETLINSERGGGLGKS